MSADRRRQLRRLEGLSVHLSLTDGSRLDDVALVSAHGIRLWVFHNGQDVFVPVHEVVDFWASQPARSAA